MKRSSIESSLKRFLKRKVKITLGVVVAFLITGAVGYGENISVTEDKAAEGTTGSYIGVEGSEGYKITGGWNYISGSSKNEDHSDSTTSITLTSGTVDELIGGNHLRDVNSAEEYTSKIGDTSVTMNGGTAEYLIGGTKSNGTKANIINGKTKVLVTGGIIGKTDVAKASLIGGNYIKVSRKGTPITAISGGTDVEITGGTFLNKVIGGSFAETYTAPISGLAVEDDATNLKISGGTFNDIVIGGGAATGVKINEGETNNTSTVGTSNLKITGGTFKSNVFAGGAALKSNVFEGGATKDGELGTVKVTNSNLTIDGTNGNLSFLNKNEIYAGGLDSGVSNAIKLIMNKVTIASSTGESKDDKIGIYGGSKAESAGVSIEDGDIEINVSDSDLYADIRGGGLASGAGSTVMAGNSKVTVSNTIVSGYEDSKNNTWTGRVFGAGKVAGGTLFEQKSTDVVINNVTGKTYIIDAGGKVGKTIGTRIYGGGQNYKYVGHAEDKTPQSLKVDSTKVTINGKDTALAQVFGGSIISGTGNKGTVSAGKTDVTINEGTIVNYVVGGNNSNWNGYSVVGIESETKTEKQYNGKYYNDGSTDITINGGDMSTAKIVGGNLVDYGWYYESKDYVIHDGIVYGTTNIDVNGGELGLLIGGGAAEYENDKAPTEDQEKISFYPTTSNVIGTTNINIAGGNLLENIIGGGYASTNQEHVKSVANVTGTTNINISGGTIKGNIYGGGFADGKSATANVDGDTNITISGGKIQGDIYAGGLVANGGKANVTGNAVVTFLTGSTFVNKVFGTGGTASGTSKSILAFGNDKEKFEGTFGGKFSNFDVLRTGKGSVVTIGKLDSTNINRNIEITGSGRIETAINEANGDIILSGGTLAADDIKLKSEKKLTLSSKGILETKSVNIFTNALDKEGTEVKESGAVNNNSIVYDGGSVALNDSNYNLDYLNKAIAAMKDKSTSKTSLLMLGTLVNIDGTVKDELTFEEAAGMGDSALLDNVTVKVEGNASLVIGDTSGSSAGAASTNNSLNASTLNFDATGTGDSGNSIAIKKDSKLVLGGSSDGELVTVDGKAGEKVSINVDAGTLVLGSALSSGANQTLSAGVTIGSHSGNTSGTLEVNAGNQTVTGKVTNNTTGIVAVNESATLKAETVENNGTLSIAGNAEIGTLTGGAGSTITVGDNDSAGTLVVTTLELKGGKIFLDPAWKKDGSDFIGSASKGAVIFKDSKIDGQIAVGQNSVMSIGGTDTEWAEKAFENSGLVWGENNITAALAIKGSQTLDTAKGSVNVNGSLREGWKNMLMKDI